MFAKATWIAVFVAILTMISPARAQVERDEAETESIRPDNRPELSAFVRAVIDANPQVNAARAALDASVALEGAAGRPLYNPELEIEAEDADSETRALGISQTLDWGGKRKARTAVAESERRSVEANYLAVRWRVTAELLSALASYQTESDRSALAAVRSGTMQDFASFPPPLRFLLAVRHPRDKLPQAVELANQSPRMLFAAQPDSAKAGSEASVYLYAQNFLFG